MLIQVGESQCLWWGRRGGTKDSLVGDFRKGSGFLERGWDSVWEAERRICAGVRWWGRGGFGEAGMQCVRELEHRAKSRLLKPDQ